MTAVSSVWPPALVWRPCLRPGSSLSAAPRLRRRCAIPRTLKTETPLRFAGVGVTSHAFPPLPVLPGNGWTDLLHNRILVTGFVSWATAQGLKVFTEYVKSGKFDLRSLVMAGGMPSSHSSVCVAVTTSIALQQGLGSALFAVAFCFTSIVMYDAAGIRRHAGYQAKILNQLMSGLRPDLGDQATLKEVLGHSRREVLGGAVLGVLVGMYWPM